ncbi:hypothetical protein LG324_14740 [Phycicoccus jejuensis]|uniref:hypothetical protein n=1 Tax=Phycicoccus jejuensis TaxID=367299 RepID=UPI00384C4AB5
MTTAPTSRTPETPASEPSDRPGVSRRRLIGWVLASGTLAVAADLSSGAPSASAAVPSPPQVPEIFDLGDLQTNSALPTSQLIRIDLDEDGVAHFASRGWRSARASRRLRR